MKHLKLSILSSALLLALPAFAEQAADSEVQDMSDPLAVYTQAGFGYTDKGLNVKIGQTYDTGSDVTMGMNIIEIKGIAGDTLGWEGETRESNDDSIDSLRFRNFGVDLTNGRGSQLDVNMAFTDEKGTQGTASYSFIQALPKMGPVQFFPLAGMGVAFGETFDPSRQDTAELRDRWDMHGTFYVAGLYGKFVVNDKIWLNYNPMYMGTMSGNSGYKDSYMDGDDSVLLHEAVVSYQINPRANVRYFANWNENTDFADGDHRVEFNYQF